MRKIGFIGAFDKTDLIIYIAKILTEVGKRVLILDTTILQKSRYNVPAIAPTKIYVTTYEDIDIAVGFEDIISAKEYLGNIENDYDFVIIDIDSSEMFSSFEMRSAEKLYFVTAFDNFSLNKGVEIIRDIGQKLYMTKVFFEKDIHDEYEEQLNLLSFSCQVEWIGENVYFPYEQGDLTAMIENQRVSKIRFRNLSEQYKDSLLMIVQDIAEEIDYSIIKRIMKKM